MKHGNEKDLEKHKLIKGQRYRRGDLAFELGLSLPTVDKLIKEGNFKTEMRGKSRFYYIIK